MSCPSSSDVYRNSFSFFLDLDRTRASPAAPAWLVSLWPYKRRDQHVFTRCHVCSVSELLRQKQRALLKAPGWKEHWLLFICCNGYFKSCRWQVSCLFSLHPGRDRTLCITCSAVLARVPIARLVLDPTGSKVALPPAVSVRHWAVSGQQMTTRGGIYWQWVTKTWGAALTIP